MSTLAGSLKQSLLFFLGQGALLLGLRYDLEASLFLPTPRGEPKLGTHSNLPLFLSSPMIFMATPEGSRHNSRFRVAHCGAEIPPKIFGSSGLLYSFSKNPFFFDCLGHKRKRLRAQSSHFQIYSHTCTSIPYMSPRTRNKIESLFTILYTTFHQSGNVTAR